MHAPTRHLAVDAGAALAAPGCSGRPGAQLAALERKLTERSAREEDEPRWPRTKPGPARRARADRAAEGANQPPPVACPGVSVDAGWRGLGSGTQRQAEERRLAALERKLTERRLEEESCALAEDEARAQGAPHGAHASRSSSRRRDQPLRRGSGARSMMLAGLGRPGTQRQAEERRLAALERKPTERSAREEDELRWPRKN